MKLSYTFLVPLTALALSACVGGAAEAPDCGDESVYDEDSGTCVAELPDCGDGEVRDEALGRCVPSGESYCAEGTVFDQLQGQCVAESAVECGEDTVEDDDQCVADGPTLCGAGTVVYGGACVPAEDVCGDGTSGDPGAGEPCEPAEDACGEGTVFDTASGRCIPESDVVCGVGTVDRDGKCYPIRDFYEELAGDPNLDMTDDGADGEIFVPEEGELFSFVGRIDEPKVADAGAIQDADVYHFDGEAGQWLRITLFSLGLPEPGFVVEFGGDAVDYRRWSDLGAGIEVARDLLLPADGSYELTVSNMPQLRETVSPAGGQDWEYVGYVETLPAPNPVEVDPTDEGFQGDLLDDGDNFYALDAFDAAGLELFFDAMPTDADAEVQVWSDETNLQATVAIDDAVLLLEELDASTLLYFDRVFSFGASTSYVASALEGVSLSDGEVIGGDVDLEAGQYVGVFQFNNGGHALSASIADGSQILAATEALDVDAFGDGQPSLYWYADSETTVAVEIENDTGDEIDIVAWEAIVGQADALDVSQGADEVSSFDGAMRPGQRHYLEWAVDFDGLVRLYAEGKDTIVSVRDDSAEEVALDGVDTVFVETEPGTYLTSAEVREWADSGVTVHVEEIESLQWSESRDPAIEIPIGDPLGADDTVHISSCPTVDAIDMDVEILHAQRGALVVYLSNPQGDMYVLKAEYGGEVSDIIGNFNETLDPNYNILSDTGPAYPIDEFVGSYGTGDWTLNVRDVGNHNYVSGTIASWSLNLQCSG